MRLRAIFHFAIALAAMAAFAASPAAADNYTVKDAGGVNRTICAKEVSTVFSTCNVIKNSAGTTIDPATEAKQDAGNASLAALDGKISAPFSGTATTTITRPADTTAYAANEVWSDSTTSPTAGGFTLSNVCSASGKSGTFLSATVISSNDPATTLIGEIWVFDSAPTAVNDNAAMALSDSDALKLVGVVPFTLGTTQGGSGANSYYNAVGLGFGYTCVGSANLRYLVKVKNAYAPASGETLTVRFSYVGTN